MNALEALAAIEEALKVGEARSIKRDRPLFQKAEEGLALLKAEKKNGARRVIQALRKLREHK